MKKLIFIALLLSFLMGNAQQDRQQFGPNGTNAPVQLYLANDIDPGHPVAFDLNRYSNRKPDKIYPGYPGQVDLNRYTIRKTDDIDPGYPSQVDINRYTIRKSY